MAAPLEPVAAEALFPSAVAAVDAGLSANAWITALRESGSGIRRAVALDLYGKARAAHQSAAAQTQLPRNAPVPLSEMKPWPTKQATGILYHAQVAYREQVTGAIKLWHVNFRSDVTLSPQDVVDQAVSLMSDKADEYNLDLVGAVFTGAHLLVNLPGS